MIKPIPFVCIGTGNIAGFLCSNLKPGIFKIIQVVGRDPVKTAEFAEKYNCSYTTSLDQISTSAGFCIIAVNDRSIPDVLENLPPLSIPLIHTSGSTPLDIFSEKFPLNGVLYPLQSIHSANLVPPKEVPFLLEAGSAEVMNLLEKLASHLSGQWMHANSGLRMQAHIAAVFASNFTNHMLALASDLMISNGLDREILLPLIRETMMRSFSTHPAKVQTGPAVRNDRSTIEKHLSMLSSLPHFQKMYTFVSDSIFEYHKPAFE